MGSKVQLTIETYLLDRVWSVEAPSSVHVRLSHILAGLAASALRLDTAIAGTTVAVLALFVQLVKVVLEFGGDRVRDGYAALVQTSLENVVGDVRLGFTADIHDVQTEHWNGIDKSVEFSNIRMCCTAQREHFGDARTGLRSAELQDLKQWTLTVAWYPRECDIHVHRQLLSPAPVHDDGRVDIDAPVVQELDRGEREDNRCRDDGHFTANPHGSRLVYQAKRVCGRRRQKNIQSAPVRVLTFTSSIVCAGN